MSRTSVSLVAGALALAVVPLTQLGPASATPSAPHRTDEPVVVDAGSARVVVERSPFRLSVTDGAGHTVLSEVAHPDEDTIAEPVTTDPLPRDRVRRQPEVR